MLGAKLGVRTIKRLILLAQARFEPEKLADPADKRWVRIGADTDDQSGHSWLDGCLDTPDALDLEAALRQIAADLADHSGEADLDLRRAQALGVMARRVLGRSELPDCGGRDARPDADEVNDGASAPRARMRPARRRSPEDLQSSVETMRSARRPQGRSREPQRCGGPAVR